MKICLLSSAHPPRDKRVFDKEAVTLAAAGFSVVHLAPGEPEHTQEHGVTITTYPRPHGLWGRLLHLPRLYRLAAHIDADCYHCNEVDSWFVGVLLKLLRHRRVVFDVHEHYPIAFAESRFPPLVHPLIATGVRLVFHALTPLTDYIVFAKRGVAVDFGGAEHKHIFVPNFTRLDVHQTSQRATPPPAVTNNTTDITAIHLGLLSRLRGWPEILDALARTKSRHVKLLIVGTFNDGSRVDFDRRVAELDLSQQVTVEDWMPFREAYQRVEMSQIGLLLFQPDNHNNVSALPHKLFDYMLAELPVIAPAFMSDVAQIIREADCGILIDPSRPDELAAALDYLVDHPDERARLGRNGHRAVVERYNWETAAIPLVDMYHELANTHRQTP